MTLSEEAKQILLINLFYAPSTQALKVYITL